MSRLFDIFQLAVLGVFLFLFLGRSVQLRLQSGVRPFNAFRQPSALEILLLVALPAWLWEVVAGAWPLPWHVVPPAWDPVLFQSPTAAGVGAALSVAGLLLFAGALASFGTSWRVGIDRATPGALVTRGVFSWSRNPIFLFLDAWTVGTFLLTGRLFFGVVALATILGIHVQILAEERFLTARHGDAYLRYLRAVPRYLGLRRPAS